MWGFNLHVITGNKLHCTRSVYIACNNVYHYLHIFEDAELKSIVFNFDIEMMHTTWDNDA